MLILKQNAANSVPTPPAGKGTIFLDDSDTLSVKTSDGNVENFPTVAASNSQVVFMNGSSLSGESALTYDFNNNILSVTGNVAAGNVKTDNLLYANGNPWDLSDPGGSNTQIQFNDDESFGGSAAFTFDKTSNLVTVGANLSANNVNVTTHITSGNVWANSGTISAQTLKGEGGNISNIQGANVSGTVGSATTAGTVTTNAQPNITSVGTLSSLVVSGTANTGAMNPTGHIIPTAAATYDLGSETNPWRDLWVSGNSIRIGNSRITSNATSLVLQNPDGGQVVVSGNSVASSTSIVSGTSNVSIPSANGNVNTSVGGTANVLVITATGANVAGYANITGNANVGNLGTAGLITATGNVSGGNLTTAGVVAATGNVSGGNLTTAGVVAATGNVSGGNLTTAGVVAATGNVTTAAQLVSSVSTGTAPLVVTSTTRVANLDVAKAGVANTVNDAAQPNITSVGTLTSLGVSGTITAANITANTGVFTGNGAALTNLAGGNVTGQVGNALVAGTVYTNAQPNITSVGTLTSLGVSGTITAANITANTGIFTGNGSGLSSITGANVTGEVAYAATANAVAGANVSGQVSNALVSGTVYTNAQPNITSVGTLTSLVVTGNATAGNVYANSGTIGASLIAGTLTTASQPNITSLGTLTSLSATGTITGGNLTTTGVLTVSGTGVSSIAGNLDMTSNTIINLATPTNDYDAATKKYVDDVAQGLNVHDSCAAATPDTLANITSGTITYNNGTAGVGAYLLTTGTFNLIDGVNVQTAGTRILVKNEANAVHNGIYTYTNTTAITRAVDFDSIPEVEAGDFTFITGGTLYDNTGWVQTSSPAAIGTAGNTIDFTQFSGAGTYNAGTGLTLTGPTFSVNASQTQVTALGNVTTGTWNSLVGSSATFAAGLSGANLASITGANVTGQVANAAVAGTVYTNAQPNITSVGTLTGLGVSGTITAANITANTGVFTGNGSGLSALAGGNVTGQVANALVAGTVYTASQPNITSVGTLTSLGVSGAVTASTLVSNVATGTAPLTVTSTTRVANLDVAKAGIANTVNDAAQPNITSVGTLTSLTVTGNASAGNISTGGVLSVTGNANVGNLGTAGLIVATGNVSGGNVNATSAVVASTLTSNVATGTAPLTVTSTTRVANLNVAYANVADFINISDVTTGTYYPVLANAATGNVAEGSNSALTFAAATGTLSATVFSGSGTSLTNLNASNISSGTLAQARLANASVTLGSTALTLGSTVTTVAGLTSVTSTTFVGALSGAATTAGTVTTAAQPNITSVGTLTSLSSSGNIVAPNVQANTGYFISSVNAAVSAAGTAQGNATVIASMVNVVSTVASGAGVALPTAVAGMRITLINTSANALLVYPASGGAINSGATNASFSQVAGGRLDFVATSTTQWYTLNATYA